MSFHCRGNSACPKCGGWNYHLDSQSDVDVFWNGGTVTGTCDGCGETADVTR